MRTLLLSLCLCLPLAAQAGDIDKPAALKALQRSDTVLIDVRSEEEFASYALPGAHLIPHEQIAERIAAVAPDKHAPIVLYCRSGRRSGIAQDRLQQLGYTQVINAGGYEQLQPLLED
ncbi:MULTISPECIES: rhodanese-like domain-containing protein [unclassified Pseudomonas]|uniref:rhodanese-like domain-containing protein n=1 Tax=unclassified Pseudomonas TaxID=196821 RepID=UPI00244A4B2F|nr:MULTISPECIES: rhodanese-like domain-containing protein [unclassified Pseudomonas]MDG9923923.1 rhodanese-like domain-containing protein [Pseudomonas sp. GD04045]MDH0035090.1 rhodanese-like domain-containing protein [Pseudomonas sp. GD04019]